MKCAWENCEKESVGKSKYCKEHKYEAKRIWLENINSQKKERDDRYAKFRLIYEEAHEAGYQAAIECVPTPMVVNQHENVLDDNSPVKKSYYIPEGLCGFAWISCYPGNTSFSHWLKKNKVGSRDEYRGGVQIWISDFGQSIARKEAYANAFAEVLHKYKDVTKTKAYADSRLD